VRPTAQRLPRGHILPSSIATIGQATPIVVRWNEDRRSSQYWTVVCGKHRIAAMKTLGRTHIAAIGFAGDDRSAALAAIAENLHRPNLDLLEKAEQIAL
jgi:ParB/RepB/Spo0J family partition protein